MAKSVQLKEEVRPHPFAQWLALYHYYRRVKNLGLRPMGSLMFENCEWQVEISPQDDFITIGMFPSQSESVIGAMEGQRLAKAIQEQENIIASVQSAYNQLQASVDMVNGKREFLEKIDKEEQPDFYIQVEKELNDMVQKLGAYEPFRKQYEEHIESAKEKIKQYKVESDNLPKVKEVARWSWTFDELKFLAE